jgi:hypothetical protein
MLFAAVHESAYGTSRHFAAPQRNGRFWGPADVPGRVASIQNNVNDPSRHLPRPTGDLTSLLSFCRPRGQHEFAIYPENIEGCLRCIQRT